MPTSRVSTPADRRQAATFIGGLVRRRTPALTDRVPTSPAKRRPPCSRRAPAGVNPPLAGAAAGSSAPWQDLGLGIPPRPHLRSRPPSTPALELQTSAPACPRATRSATWPAGERATTPVASPRWLRVPGATAPNHTISAHVGGAGVITESTVHRRGGRHFASAPVRYPAGCTLTSTKRRAER
jgi:hypothetical protein